MRDGGKRFQELSLVTSNDRELTAASSCRGKTFVLLLVLVQMCDVN